jgi:hypothetical protein
MESFFIRKVVIMMVSGKKIKCMGLESFFMPINNLHIKVNGSRICFRAMELFLMISQPFYTILLITITLICFNSNGNIMKEAFTMIRSKVMEK